MTDISPLTADRYRESIAADGAAIGLLCRQHPDRTVPSCPEWTGADLMAHLTSFTTWLRALFAGTPLEGPLPQVEPHDAVRDWDETLDHLVALLRDTDPSSDVPNWSTGQQTAAFWLRRTAQDVAIHRWDAARLVTDAPDPVPADVARDGVGEYLDVFVTTAFAMGHAPDNTAHDNSATVELEMTDFDHTVRRDLPSPGPITTLRGTASDLLLGLWHRLEPRELVVGGDAALMATWPHI